MERIGLLFGSFNPIHNGHTAIAEKCLSEGLVDTVCFVVAYQNPFKEKYEVDFWNRSIMVQNTVEHNENFVVSHVEKLLNDLNKSTKTYDVINHFKNRKIDAEYYIICGDDVYYDIKNWYNGDKLFEENKFIIFTRNSKDKIINHHNIAGYINIDGFENISSSKIREMIKNNDDVSHLINLAAYDLIKKQNFYI